ncbi:hypothetical protein N0V83_005121 [Neocucurbitaria cava]|uniref:Uncharacterized protein n=1 Tax=Neocucurbitaria cava TaxID=798079 RepID=A0A9W8Y8L0_9PLEO|nr:hypothetical protein N0V83_005121 [Neocucurbitaria cava]
MNSCTDGTGEILEKLHEEWDHIPFYNDVCDAHDQEEYRGDMLAYMVYIQHFTTDGLNFAYYIRGGANIAKFCAGAFGMQVYSGPIFGTPVVLNGRKIMLSGHADLKDQHDFTRVRKHGPQTEKVKWRYMLETARLLWNTMEFQMDIYAELGHKRNLGADSGMDNNRDRAAGRDPGADWEVESVHSNETSQSEKMRGKMKMKEPEIEGPEIKSEQAEGTAIRDNLIAIKREGGSADDLLDYLREEDLGSRTSSGPSVFTVKQESLITSLHDARNLLGDLEERRVDFEARGVPMSEEIKELESALKRDIEGLLEEF